MQIPRPKGRGTRALMASTLLACTALAGVATSAAADNSPPAAGRSASTAAVPRPDHVVMVMMENKDPAEIFGTSTRPQDQDPFIRSLAAGGASFTNSFGIQHPSDPNYYALMSGTDDVTSNDVPPPSSLDVDNLPNELVTHGLSYDEYAGTDYGVPNDFLRYTTTPGTAANPNPMDKSERDFPTTPDGYAQLPTVSFAFGSNAESMHDGTIAQGDAWLKSKFGGYIDWAKTHNSLFVLTWDEDDFGPLNQIPTLMVGPMAKAGNYGEFINHYSVLRTVLDMYGLPHINHTADAGINTITDAFDLSKTEHLSGQDGRCAADRPTGGAGTNALTMRHCENADGQQWLRHGDGTLRVDGRCMTSTDGSAVTLAACDGTPAQVWQPKDDLSLVNPASGRCLDDPGTKIDKGAEPTLKDCDGTAGQKWDVPDYAAPKQLTLGGAAVVKPGSTATVTTTYTPTSSPTTVRGASVHLTVPSGWKAKATSRRTFNSLAPGQSATTTWSVTAPAGATPESYSLAAAASYRNGGDGAQAFGQLSVPFASETAARNDIGISDDSNPGAGNLDSGNRSFSAQTLAAAGLTPGARVTHDGLTFTWPDTAPGTSDNTWITAPTTSLTQTPSYPITGTGTKLGFLATAAGDTSGTGTITYTDGTTQPYSLVMNDWTNTNPPAPGTDILASLPHRNTSGGPQNLTVQIYGATVALRPGRTVAYLTLPDAAGLHVFTTAIG